MTSLKVRSNVLIVDTRSISFKMSRDFCCKDRLRQSKSVILVILCIKYKFNKNSKDLITIKKKKPPASPRIELKDPSWTILSSKIIVAPCISIKLQIESKWELHWVVPLRCKLPISLAPVVVSHSPIATICIISIVWAQCKSIWYLGEALIRLIMVVNLFF